MTEFDLLYDLLPSGWLTRDEAGLLYTTLGRTTGPILEVGCYRGRSSVLLASAGRPLYCVDPFRGFDSDDSNGDGVKADWLRHTAGFRNVTLFAVPVEEWEPRPVGFAYLDGDHTRAGTLAQIDKAKACGAGAIAVHDVNDKGGGLEVKRACLRRLGKWKTRVGRLAVWEGLT